MLLKNISESADPVSTGDVEGILEVSSDIAFRTLKTLEECGFVCQIEGGYVLGEAVGQLWRSYRNSLRRTIDRAQKALRESAIVGEEE
jgi:DNA-binding IclR family transcriptional regulator